MIKNKLVGPTLQVLFLVMSEVNETEEDDDDEDDQVESSKPSTVAAQTLNGMVSMGLWNVRICHNMAH